MSRELMVIRGKLPANTLADNLAGDLLHIPADRCAWTIFSHAASGGYQVGKAFLIHSTANVAISNPCYGYIGKSGRFVGIAS